MRNKPSPVLNYMIDGGQRIVFPTRNYSIGDNSIFNQRLMNNREMFNKGNKATILGKKNLFKPIFTYTKE